MHNFASTYYQIAEKAMFGFKKNEKYVMSLMKLREIKKGIGCNRKFNSVFKNTESSTSTSETSEKLFHFFLYSRFFSFGVSGVCRYMQNFLDSVSNQPSNGKYLQELIN